MYNLKSSYDLHEKIRLHSYGLLPISIDYYPLLPLLITIDCKHDNAVKQNS